MGNTKPRYLVTIKILKMLESRRKPRVLAFFAFCCSSYINVCKTTKPACEAGSEKFLRSVHLAFIFVKVAVFRHYSSNKTRRVGSTKLAVFDLSRLISYIRSSHVSAYLKNRTRRVFSRTPRTPRRYA